LMRDLYKDGNKVPVVRFERGYFELFNRTKKKTLYDMARTTKRKSYQLIKANMNGRFTDNYPLDEKIYKQKKLEALQRFKEKKDKEKMTDLKFQKALAHFIKVHKEKNMTGDEIVLEVEDKLGVTYSTRRINEIHLENERTASGGRELISLTYQEGEGGGAPLPKIS